jgi:hypothetical protein
MCFPCNRGDVRLQGLGGTVTFGYIEICNNGTWGSVCSSSWGTADAQVVCRQLGYETLGIHAAMIRYCGSVWWYA